jgi:hypothetical protein
MSSDCWSSSLFVDRNGRQGHLKSAQEEHVLVRRLRNAPHKTKDVAHGLLVGCCVAHVDGVLNEQIRASTLDPIGVDDDGRVSSPVLHEMQDQALVLQALVLQ